MIQGIRSYLHSAGAGSDEHHYTSRSKLFATWVNKKKLGEGRCGFAAAGVRIFFPHVLCKEF